MNKLWFKKNRLIISQVTEWEKITIHGSGFAVSETGNKDGRVRSRGNFKLNAFGNSFDSMWHIRMISELFAKLQEDIC